MRKTAKKICSLALALALALCCLPAAFAAENTITVSFSFYNGAVVIPKGELCIYDGIAEEYGFDLRGAEDITVFDALVAAHKAYYGDMFTPETVSNYLVMSSGFITKAFELSTASLGFFVNNEMPNDGVFNSDYNSYTGYACDQAIIKEGDFISFFAYSDTLWLDYYITPSPDKVEVMEGEEFTVSANGYSAMWYGCYREEDRAAYTYPMAGFEVSYTSDKKTYTKIGNLDENGEITHSFDESGKYCLLIEGKFNDPAMGEIIAVGNWVEVTVNEPEPDLDPEPEPEYDDAIYIPNSFKISVDTESKEGIAVVSIKIGLFDIFGKAPSKSECLSFEISFAPIVTLIRFIADIIR